MSNSNTVQPWAKTKLPIKINGRHLTVFEYKAKDTSFTKSKIKSIAQDLIAKERDGRNGKVAISTYFDQSIGWQTGKFTSIGDSVQDLNFYDFSEQYENAGIELQSRYPRFLVTVDFYPTSGGDHSTKEVVNDCLYQALKKAYGGFRHMPPALQGPYKVWKAAGIEANQPIPIDNLKYVEARGKVKIQVSGDVDRVSSAKHGKQVHLKLVNGHYSLDKSKRSKVLYRGVSKVDRRIEVYRDVADGMCEVYDGLETNLVPRSVIVESFRKHTDVIYRKQDRRDELAGQSLEAFFVQITSDAAEMRKHSGYLNPYRQRNDKQSALNLFYYLSYMIPEPPELGESESKWVEYAMSGGVRFAQPGLLPSAFGFDLNKMYSHVLTSSNYLPWGEGEVTQVSSLSECITGCNDRVYRGLYRAKVWREGEAQPEDRLFKFSSNNHYTHLDLQTAREIGLSIELIHDDLGNYCKFSKWMSAKTVFEPFVSEMLLMLKAGVPRAKLILNSLWGGLCEQKKVYVNGSTTESKDNHELRSIKPMGIDGEYWLELADRSKRFKTPYARIGPFVTGYARRLLFEQLKEYAQHIRYIHTDGAILTERVPLELGRKMGQWKVEKWGRCRVHSMQRVDAQFVKKNGTVVEQTVD